MTRFARVCSTFPAFRYNSIKLVIEMVREGYHYPKLRRILRDFRNRFAQIQAVVFHKRRHLIHKLGRLDFHVDNTCPQAFKKLRKLWRAMLYRADQLCNQ